MLTGRHVCGIYSSEGLEIDEELKLTEKQIFDGFQGKKISIWIEVIKE
jgi:hypothetical protein